MLLLLVSSLFISSGAQATGQKITAQCDCHYLSKSIAVSGQSQEGDSDKAIANAKLKCFVMDSKSLVRMKFDARSCNISGVGDRRAAGIKGKQRSL